MPRWPESNNADAVTAQNEKAKSPASDPDLPDFRSNRILSVRERNAINQDLGRYRMMAGASEAGYVPGTQEPGAVIPRQMRFDRNKMNDQARHLLDSLKKGSPPELNAKQRDAAAKRAKEIEDILHRDQVLETRQEIHVVRKDNPVYYDALDKAKMRHKYNGLINEWRNIKRTLEPDDQDAASLDRLRYERHTGK